MIEKRTKEFEQAVRDILKFGAETFPDLPALDTAGVMLIAGTRVGHAAGLTDEMPALLRQLADRFERRTAERGLH